MKMKKIIENIIINENTRSSDPLTNTTNKFRLSYNAFVDALDEYKQMIEDTFIVGETIDIWSPNSDDLVNVKIVELDPPAGFDPEYTKNTKNRSHFSMKILH